MLAGNTTTVSGIDITCPLTATPLGHWTPPHQSPEVGSTGTTVKRGRSYMKLRVLNTATEDMSGRLLKMDQNLWYLMCILLHTLGTRDVITTTIITVSPGTLTFTPPIAPTIIISLGINIRLLFCANVSLLCLCI